MAWNKLTGSTHNYTCINSDLVSLPVPAPVRGNTVFVDSEFTLVYDGTNFVDTKGMVQIVVNNTTELAGMFSCVKAMDDATFEVFESNITMNGFIDPLTPAGIGVLNAGDELIGEITRIKLSSGKVKLFLV